MSPSEFTTDTYREVLTSVDGGGQGFLGYMGNSLLVSSITVIVLLATPLLVYVAQTVPVAIYVLRNYFSTIPVSLEEAALIDGCTRFGVIRRISLPLSMPSLIATGLYVLVERRDNWTVSLGLSRLSGSIEVPTTVLMAGSVVLTVPIIGLFFLAERMLVEGLTSGAEKG